MFAIFHWPNRVIKLIRLVEDIRPTRESMVKNINEVGFEQQRADGIKWPETGLWALMG